MATPHSFYAANAQLSWLQPHSELLFPCCAESAQALLQYCCPGSTWQVHPGCAHLLPVIGLAVVLMLESFRCHEMDGQHQALLSRGCSADVG